MFEAITKAVAKRTAVMYSWKMSGHAETGGQALGMCCSAGGIRPALQPAEQINGIGSRLDWLHALLLCAHRKEDLLKSFPSAQLTSRSHASAVVMSCNSQLVMTTHGTSGAEAICEECTALQAWMPVQQPLSCER